MTDSTPPRRSRRRIALAAGFGAAALTLTGVGVYAGLNATATGTQSVSSGTLLLSLAGNGAGFTAPVSNMAPGDTVDRYVDLTNGGTLDGKTLTLGVAAGSSNLLSTDATKGLQVAVKACTGGTWTATTGVCSGTPSTVLATTAVSVLSTTPGTVAATFAAAAALHLQVVLTLPDQTETSTNGVLPGGTIQGLSTTLTYTFSEQQRAATTTDS